MRAVVYIATASVLVNTVTAVNPKQLNIALETVLQFDKKDRAADIAVIDKVQDFLNQIKHGMQGNARRNAKNDITFTDFILQAAKTFKSLDDDKLEDAFVIIKEESRRYVNREKDLQELFNNKGMRRYINDKLDNVTDMSAGELRRYLNAAINIIEYLTRRREKNNALEIGNTLYNGASKKLRRALRNLDKIRRENSFNLVNILRSTLDFLVYNHYLNLGQKVRNELVSAVQYFWRTFTGEDNDKHVTTNVHFLRTTPFKNQQKSKSVYTTRNYAQFPQPKTRLREKISVKEEVKRAPKTPEVFLTQNELNNIINKGYKENTKDIASAPHIKEKRIRKLKAEMKSGYLTQENEHNMLYSTNDEGKKYARNRDSGELFLMGGQVTRDYNFRAKVSSAEEEDLIGEDEREDITSTEEIVIQHNNIIDVGLSRKTPGRLNITFVSTENDKKNMMRNKASHEYSETRRISRKSNINDTLEDNDRFYDVKIMIENLLEQIEDVKDQVEYVKSLTLTRLERSDKNYAFNTKTDNVTSNEAVESNTYSFNGQYAPDPSERRNQEDTAIFFPENTLPNITNSKTSNEKNKLTQKESSKNDNIKKIDFDKSNKNVTQGDIGMGKNKTDVTNKAEGHNSSVTEVNNSTVALVEKTISSKRV